MENYCGKSIERGCRIGHLCTIRAIKCDNCQLQEAKLKIIALEEAIFKAIDILAKESIDKESIDKGVIITGVLSKAITIN